MYKERTHQKLTKTKISAILALSFSAALLLGACERPSLSSENPCITTYCGENMVKVKYHDGRCLCAMPVFDLSQRAYLP